MQPEKDLWSFFNRVTQGSRLLIFMIMLTSIIIGSTPAIDNYLLKIITDKIVGFSETATEDEYFKEFFAIIIIYLIWWQTIDWIWKLYSYITSVRFLPRVKASIMVKMHSYILRHSYKFFQNEFTGSIANRINEMATAFDRIVDILSTGILHKISMLVFGIALMWSVSFHFGIIVIFWVIIFFVINYLGAKYILQFSDNFALQKAKTAGILVDSISNFLAVKLFARFKYEKRYLKNSVKTVVEADKQLNIRIIIVNLIVGFTYTIFLALVLFYLIKLRAANKISIGDFVLVLNLYLSIVENMWNLGKEFSSLSNYIGAARQSLQPLSIEHGVKDCLNAKNLEVKKGVIEFKNVRFRFSQEHDLMFDETSITIKGGEKVGLVGYSGSGKTTFVNLITRLLDIESGVIEIDGQDISRVKQNSLRENISLIQQDPILFHRSLYENIRYGDVNATREQVIQAAKDACAHDFIIKLEDGYDTEVGERGVKLSGGQRQRVAIARAILKNAKIIILDEATSALDSVTEKYIQETVEKILKGKTVLVIAHRLSTLLSMDRILVFSEGRIVEEGTHRSLLAKNGTYAKLWQNQINGFLT